MQLIARAVQGNLRQCANLCYASLLTTRPEHQRICATTHVNAALIQPHYRSHEALLKQQLSATAQHCRNTQSAQGSVLTT